MSILLGIVLILLVSGFALVGIGIKNVGLGLAGLGWLLGLIEGVSMVVGYSRGLTVAGQRGWGNVSLVTIALGLLMGVALVLGLRNALGLVLSAVFAVLSLKLGWSKGLVDVGVKHDWSWPMVSLMLTVFQGLGVGLTLGSVLGILLALI